MHKLLILLSLLSGQVIAFTGGCKLNQFGHNICVGEKSLYLEKNDEIGVPVTIIEHKYDSTIIRQEHQTLAVNIDKLVGKKICSSDEFPCAGQNVRIKNECNLNLQNKEYKVLNVFENGFLQATTLFAKKSYIVAETCVQIQ